MRPLFALLAVTLSSCSIYQYHTLTSALPESGKNEFTYEDDSVAITYRFHGYEGPIQIEVKNKLREPIYVDWSKSALIKKDQMHSYIKDEARFTAEIDDYTMLGVGYSTANGSIEKVEKMDIILPGVFRNKTVNMYLARSNFQINERTPREYVKFGFGKAEKYSFSQHTTPLAFRSYLTILDNSKTIEKSYDHDFWITDVHQVSKNPTSLALKNEFYTSEPSNDGPLLLVLLTGGVIWLAAEAPKE